MIVAPGRLRYWILLSDAVIIVVATLTAYFTRFGNEAETASITGPIQIVGTLLPLFWLAVLITLGAYDRRFLFVGLREYSRIGQSAVVVVALVSSVSFLFKFDTSRAYVLLTIPLALLLLLTERWIWRRYLLRQRMKGIGLARTLLVGDEAERRVLSQDMAEKPWAGYEVVAELPLNDSIEDPISQIITALETHNCTALALAGSTASDAPLVREISWQIEGRSIDLLVAAGLGGTTGPRVSLRIATGLPLLHLDEVTLRTTQRIAKRSLDLVGSALLLITLSPLFVSIGLAILVSSGLPVSFRQARAGRDEEIFTMWKFRTMTRDADSQRQALRQVSGTKGPIFKAERDPRITKIGHFLRRWSLDELPQLINVLGGSMSLVGPRPHPLDDVDRYAKRDRRRLLAKPGMTGLWQIAGRSDLDWDQSIEMDLLYIENWTFLGDLVILARTLQAVIQGDGAR